MQSGPIIKEKGRERKRVREKVRKIDIKGVFGKRKIEMKTHQDNMESKWWCDSVASHPPQGVTLPHPTHHEV